jgi:hypothetical protein
MIDNRKPSALFQALPSKWNAQIVRIPVNSQWYMWDIDTGYPAGPAGMQMKIQTKDKLIITKTKTKKDTLTTNYSL